MPHLCYNALGVGCLEEPARWPGSREGRWDLCPAFRENPISLRPLECYGLRDVTISRTSLFFLQGKRQKRCEPFSNGHPVWPGAGMGPRIFQGKALPVVLLGSPCLPFPTFSPVSLCRHPDPPAALAALSVRSRASCPGCVKNLAGSFCVMSFETWFSYSSKKL